MVSRSTGTLRYRLARLGRLVRPVLSYFIGWVVGKSRPKNEDARRDQCRSSEDAKREQPPFVELPPHIPSYRPGSVCALLCRYYNALRVGHHSQLAASITLNAS